MVVERARQPFVLRFSPVDGSEDHGPGFGLIQDASLIR
jgi:hypothetical protein